MRILDKKYWKLRYQKKDIPWDTGKITRPIKDYFDKEKNKKLKILIPGAGAGHEAVYLYQQGFKNVWVCDWAEEAFDILKQNCPDFPKEQLLISDFFDLSMQVDIIVEQTFFCAILPTQRVEYIEKVAQLLHKKGKLLGLLFAVSFPHEGPPFGGTKTEYLKLFESHFNIHTIEIAKNSIKPRVNREFFIEMSKKVLNR